MKTQSIKDLIRVAAAMVACMFASVPAFAAEWYVDAVNGDDSYDGKTVQTAKKTIQAAIDSGSATEQTSLAELEATLTSAQTAFKQGIWTYIPY